MDFFNVGTGELLFLALLAILLVGPKRAVELMQQAGRLMARLRQEWMAVQRDVLAEVQAIKGETLEAVGPSLPEELRQLAEEMKAVEREVLATRGAARPHAPGGATVAPPPEMLGSGEEKAG